jgi:hypothetical protein
VTLFPNKATFETRSYSEILRVKISTYLLGEQIELLTIPCPSSVNILTIECPVKFLL